MKRRNRAAVLGLAGILLAAGSVQTAKAQDALVLDNSVQIEETSSEVTEIFDWNFEETDEIAPLGEYYCSGTAKISKRSSTSVYIAGETRCYEVCPTVTAKATLQQLKNSTWVNVATRSKTGSNVHTLIVGDTISVSSGYYYRVVSEHSATKNGKTESEKVPTGSLYVG